MFALKLSFRPVLSGVLANPLEASYLISPLKPFVPGKRQRVLRSPPEVHSYIIVSNALVNLLFA